MKRYQVKGRIGAGGLGDVYLAEDTRLNREVALKRVRTPEGGDPAAVEQDLLREARTLSALQHPNIVTIYDAGSDEEGPFVIMEYLKGETLDQVASRGALTVDDFSEVVIQSLEGMIAAQSLGLVHRDLKPSNLMVIWLASGKFQVKILDFGLAKFSQTAVPQTEDQESGIMGSIFFMAPEQFERLPLDARTDMYSLGCIFYQILTTKYAFDGRTGPEVMASHLQHHVTPIQDVRHDLPEWMGHWVMWLISREMEERPPDARAALDYFIATRTEMLNPTPQPPAPPKAKTVRIVGRGSGPAGVSVARPAPNVPATGKPRKPATRRVGGAGAATGARAQQGSNATARSSRPTARRVKHGRKGSGGGHKGVWISALVLLALGLGGAAWYYLQGRQQTVQDDAAVLESLVASSAPVSDPETLELLHGFIGRGGGDSVRATEVLLRLKGPNTGKAIARALGVADGISRTLLMNAVADHPDDEGIAAIANIASANTGAVRTTALESLEKAAAPKHVPELLKVLPAIRGESDRTRFFRAVKTILSRESDPASRIKPLAAALTDATAELRPDILHLLGETGQPEAVAVLAAELKSTGERADAAMVSAATWPMPTPELAEALFEAAKSGSGDRAAALDAFARTAPRVAGWSADEIAQKLRDALALTGTAHGKEAVCAALATVASPAARGFAQEMATSPDATLAEAAGKALQSIEQLLPRVQTAGETDLTLDAGHARIAGPNQDAYYSATTRYITNWKQPDTTISWDVEVDAGRTFEVSVLQSTTQRAPRSFRVRFGGESAEREVVPTPTSGEFESVECGSFAVPRKGVWRLWVEPVVVDPGSPLMNVREVVLTPAP